MTAKEREPTGPDDAGFHLPGDETITVHLYEKPIPLMRGRPPKAEGERKGRNLTFRVRENLRARLQQAADVSGRSISEEIESRVEATFRSQDALVRELAGPEAGALIPPLLVPVFCG